MKEIYVTKPFIPDRDKFNKYIDKIYRTSQLTNNGPLVQELEKRLKKYLGVKNIVLTANGTLALQVAYKLLELKGEVITTPFSFVATSSSLVWDNLTPVYVDINKENLNIDPSLIESKITDKTSALVPVHVFGNPCEVEKIKKIANKYNLKIIYDAAHAFDVKYKNESILNWGDISILSFHATKLFHTIEGGAIIINDKDLYKKAKGMISFGYGEEGIIKGEGINAKMNEFSGAMGLCLLDDIGQVIDKRKKVWVYYYQELKDVFILQEKTEQSTNNYHYFPIILKSANERAKIQEKLNQNKIYPRRYFWPSLDTLNHIKSKQRCKVSRDLSNRILCLPIFPDLKKKDQVRIIKIIKDSI